MDWRLLVAVRCNNVVDDRFPVAKTIATAASMPVPRMSVGWT
jgi:hypothetical protein